ncbi:hypothetical protein M378DRAFT_178885 [Amanita muscaria Koide BX008]|uniref:Uncharacterized protein n=1 Tax=Amanita muscaria (strain Koide BX008) TaxID=946122 RepID=A0A0C2TBT9_AMAMK|nr:hypothetical protein M378DRAFT_178885 [Amanita muscaria Koide BX008]
MPKLFKVAVVILMLAFAVCTSANPSFCKCQHPETGKPDNGNTENCCFNGPDYGAHVTWSEEHNRCDCDDETLYNNRAIWAKCCVYENPLEVDMGYDCCPMDDVLSKRGSNVLDIRDEEEMEMVGRELGKGGGTGVLAAYLKADKNNRHSQARMANVLTSSYTILSLNSLSRGSQRM